MGELDQSGTPDLEVSGETDVEALARLVIYAHAEAQRLDLHFADYLLGMAALELKEAAAKRTE